MIPAPLLVAQAGDGFVAPRLDYGALAPEIVLTCVVVVVLLADLVLDETRKYLLPSIASIGVLTSAFPVLYLAIDGTDRSMFGGAYVSDDFALLLKALFLFTGYVVLLMSNRYIEEGDYHQGEYYFLLLSSLLGMVVMASARDLVTIFVALELLSIPAYLLAGWRKRDLKSNEASLKYYLLGTLASGVMLYGMSLVFGATGTTVLTEIGRRLAAPGALTAVVTLGIFFVIVGFAFKVSAVPFHFWAPDTYEGAPTPVTAFLSVASKSAGFVALMEIVYVGFLGRSDVWAPLFWVLSALTMTIGNLIALRQTNIVRMLAYSSVAQSGYVLVPFAVAPEGGALQSAQSASVIYLLIYSAMNLGAFAIVILLGRRGEENELLSDYAGLGYRQPVLAFLMSIFMLSLAGIPPTAGFVGKFYIFAAAMQSGQVVLAVIGVLASVISVYFYLRVIYLMYMVEPEAGRTFSPLPRTSWARTAAIVTGIGVLLLGLLQNLINQVGTLSSYTQQMTSGAFLIIVVTIQIYLTRKRNL